MTRPAEPLDDAAESAALLKRQLRMLDALSEQGLEIASVITDRVKASEPGDGVDLNTLAMAHARVARAVRMAVLLQSQLLKDHHDLQKARTRDAEWAGKDQRRDRRHSVARLVGRAHGKDSKSGERLAREALQRLDDDDIYGDVLTYPISELVAMVCQDMGLPEPDWSRMAGEAWTLEEAATRDPESPFATSPIAEAMAGGGPPAEERVVEGAGGEHDKALRLVSNTS